MGQSLYYHTIIVIDFYGDSYGNIKIWNVKIIYNYNSLYLLNGTLRKIQKGKSTATPHMPAWFVRFLRCVRVKISTYSRDTVTVPKIILTICRTWSNCFVFEQIHEWVGIDKLFSIFIFNSYISHFDIFVAQHCDGLFVSITQWSFLIPHQCILRPFWVRPHVAFSVVSGLATLYKCVDKGSHSLLLSIKSKSSTFVSRSSFNFDFVWGALSDWLLFESTGTHIDSN